MNEQHEGITLSPRRRLLPILLIIIGAGDIAAALVFGAEGLSTRNQLVMVGAGLVLVLFGIGLNIPQLAHRIVQFAARWTSQPDRRPQPGEIVLLGIWFGLLTGLLEAAFQLVKMLTVQSINVPESTSLDVIWMAPITDAALFAAMAVVLAFAAWCWPELVSFGLVTFVFAFGGFRALLLMAPGLNDLAEIVLAAGLAFQVARLMASRTSRLYAITRRTGGWLYLFRHQQPKPKAVETQEDAPALLSRRQFLVSTGATVGGLALGVYGGKLLPEQIKLRQIPLATSNLPNVLLIVLDTVRAQNLSLYGYQRLTTPHLEHFAKRGVVFRQAVASAPWTLPSHATMFTGRWHHELSVGWNSALDATYPTLAEVLSQQGYLCAGFVANLDFCTEQFGLNRGFLHYESWPVSLGQAVLSTAYGRDVSNRSTVREAVGFYDLLNRKDAADITDGFLQWLPDQTERPFFAFLNYYDAHQLYLPPAPFDTMFGPRRTRNQFIYFTHAAEPEAMWSMSTEEVQAELDAYDGAIAYVDSQLGRLFVELESRGVLDNTLVIVASDHGEQFGEHGLFGHTNSLYIQTLHVPLLMALPSRLPTEIEVPEWVSLRDLPATVLDVLGLETAFRFPGGSLARYWQRASEEDAPVSDSLLSEIYVSEGAVQEWYPVTEGEMKSIVSGKYHYIRESDGQEELYDLEKDPLEQQDLAASPEHAARLTELRASLEAALVST